MTATAVARTTVRENVQFLDAKAVELCADTVRDIVRDGKIMKIFTNDKSRDPELWYRECAARLLFAFVADFLANAQGYTVDMLEAPRPSMHQKTKFHAGKSGNATSPKASPTKSIAEASYADVEDDLEDDSEPVRRGPQRLLKRKLSKLTENAQSDASEDQIQPARKTTRRALQKSTYIEDSDQEVEIEKRVEEKTARYKKTADRAEKAWTMTREENQRYRGIIQKHEAEANRLSVAYKTKLEQTQAELEQTQTELTAAKAKVSKLENEKKAQSELPPNPRADKQSNTYEAKIDRLEGEKKWKDNLYETACKFYEERIENLQKKHEAELKTAKTERETELKTAKHEHETELKMVNKAYKEMLEMAKKAMEKRAKTDEEREEHLRKLQHRMREVVEGCRCRVCLA